MDNLIIKNFIPTEVFIDTLDGSVLKGSTVYSHGSDVLKSSGREILSELNYPTHLVNDKFDSLFACGDTNSNSSLGSNKELPKKRTRRSRRKNALDCYSLNSSVGTGTIQAKVTKGSTIRSHESDVLKSSGREILSEISCPTHLVNDKFDSSFACGDTNSNSSLVSNKETSKRRTRRSRRKKVLDCYDLNSSVEAETIQANPVTETESESSHSFSLLTNRIGRLLTSLERKVAEQSEHFENHEEELNVCHNTCCKQRTHRCDVHSHDWCNDNSFSCFHRNSHAGLSCRTLLDENNCQRESCFSYSSSDCCRNIPFGVTHCFMELHSQYCHEKYIPRCLSSSRESCMNCCANSPNIMIPLQNVTSDILYQIVSILKTETQSV